ncbi:MAG: carbohydrate ABC transporter permease [Geitlerinemataceae cyanobacterium]
MPSTATRPIVQRLTPYLFLAPAAIALILTVFWPTLQAFYLSFTQYGYDLTQAPQWVGPANLQRLWRDPLFWKTLGQTLLYLVCAVPILVAVPLVLAVLVNRQLRGIRWFRAAYYTPVVISMVVAGLAWKYLYAENGLFNALLAAIGFTDGIPWLTSPDLALFSVAIVTIWKGLGYYMTIYLAGLQSIPEDLYEAAALDGSDGWQRHWDITVPLMRPYLVLVAVISSLSAMKVFEEVFVMTQGGPLDSSKTVVYYLYEQAFSRQDMSYACTIGLALFLAILLLSLVNLSLTWRREADE